MPPTNGARQRLCHPKDVSGEDYVLAPTKGARRRLCLCPYKRCSAKTLSSSQWQQFSRIAKHIFVNQEIDGLQYEDRVFAQHKVLAATRPHILLQFQPISPPTK